MEKFGYPRFGVRFILIAIVSLIVSEYASMDGLAVRVHTREFYIEYGSTLFIAVLTMELLFSQHLWMEKKYSWKSTPVVRLVLQVMIGIILPALIVFTLASIYFRFFGVSIYETNYLAYAFPFIVALIFLANIVLIALPYFLEGVGLIKHQRQSIPVEGQGELSVKDIAGVYILNEVVFVIDFDGNEYICPHALDVIEAWLDPSEFCRANRQLIACAAACTGYQPAEFGKLILQMEPVPPVPTTVSQRKAVMVKRWLGST